MRSPGSGTAAAAASGARLDVSFTQKWNQFTNEVAIHRSRRIAVRDVELIQRRLDYLPQGSAGEVDAGVTLEQPKDPLHVPLCALPACNGKDAPELFPLVGGALAQGVDEHERPFTLPDVAQDLLAVLGLIADQVQDVVLDLERRAEQETEQVEAVGVDRSGCPDQCSDAARVDARVPARFLEDQPQIVVLGQLEDIVARPTELERLALNRLQDEMLRLMEDPVCELST